MKIDISSDGVLSFHASDLFDHLDGSAVMDIARAMGCTDAVIKHVADQIIDKMTDNGDHGRRCGDGCVDPSSAVSVARRRVALAAGDIAAAELAAMTEKLREAEAAIWRISVARRAYRAQMGEFIFNALIAAEFDRPVRP